MTPSQSKALATQSTALVAYEPKSQAPYRLNTLTPRNMAFELQKALNKITLKHGNLDEYVRQHLQYADKQNLWKALGAEQVDSVAMYLHQFEQNAGIIIADQTGIGKGRQAAAVIRHAVLNGYLPIFFTRKPDLFSDMYRDLQNIDFADKVNPFILNTDSHAKVKDSHGHVVFSPLSKTAQYEKIVKEKEVKSDSKKAKAWYEKNKIPMPDFEKTKTLTLREPIDFLPKPYNVIFSTYSQIQAAQPYKRTWLASLVSRGVEGSQTYKKVVFVLDESHMAGGYDAIIGEWMRSVLPHSKSCCYLSATFAKYPEVMPLYKQKTAIQHTGLDNLSFVSAMKKGGLALQEIVAANLAESGQLIRRQRSSEGIKVVYQTLDQEPERSKNRQSVDTIIALMNKVVSFEEEYISPHLAYLHELAKKEGDRMKDSPSSLGVKQSPYFSRVFNIVDQMLFSLKVKKVAEQTLKLLREDKKVVIAFKSTMGSFLADLKLASGDALPMEQLDFSRTLIKGLDSVFYYNYTDITGNKTREKIELEELPDSAEETYHALKKEMAFATTDLTISPIDELIHLISSEKKDKGLGGHHGSHFTVAEVTGRNQRLRFEDGQAIAQGFRSDTEKSFRLFNQGEYDVLLINQSGSTGSSAHSSKDFADQRVRCMLIHQFELDINVEVQKRGRINRTGQVNLPEYYYIVSDIPAEQRLMTMLKAKLKSLDANTTGSQKTSEESLKSKDLFNKYGDKVAWEWVNENRELTQKMGNPTYRRVKKRGRMIYERNFSSEGAMKQLTGRAGLLSVAQQTKLYDELFAAYEDQIDYEKQNGTYDLETEFLALDAEVKAHYLFEKGKGGNSPFGRDTIREVCIVNNLKRPYSKAQLEQAIIKALDGKKAEQVQQQLIKEINQAYPKLMKERLGKRQEVIDKVEKEYEELPELGSHNTEKENERLKRQHEKFKELIKTKKANLTTFHKALKETQHTLIQFFTTFLIGEGVLIPNIGEVAATPAVFLGFHIDKKSKNPYTLSKVSLRFAISDSRKVMNYKCSGEQEMMLYGIEKKSQSLSQEEKQNILLDWNELVKNTSAKRQKRHILTQNIVGASNRIGSLNRLIKYNTTTGEIKNGIFMHIDYGSDGEDKKSFYPISDAYQYIQALEENEFFADHQLNVRFKRLGGALYELAIRKAGNFEMFTNKDIRSLLERAEGKSKDELPDFVQNANEMVGVIHERRIETLLHLLDNYDLRFLGETRPLEPWEIENEKAWEEETKESNELWVYQLNKAFGQASYPAVGFKGHQDNNAPEAPFGVLTYSRPLTDKEKYSYSLIPLFDNIAQPYQAWKKHIASSEALSKEWTALIAKMKDQPTEVAMDELGFFIFHNAHEEGRTPFVFGLYDRQDYGRIAYQEEIGEIVSLKELIQKLTIELNISG